MAYLKASFRVLQQTKPMKYISILMFVVLLTAPHTAAAESGGSTFRARIMRAQTLVAEHDLRSVDEIWTELQGSVSAEGNLQIYEAVAETYRDLTADGKIAGEAEKRGLYDKIRMNVAFIQFGGDPNYGGGAKINLWIRRSLMKYLSRDLINDDTMFHSADEWSKTTK